LKDDSYTGFYTMAKKGINVAVESGRLASQLFEQAQSVYCCGTEDKLEATTAWLEKRKPVFKGK
jgi:enoyl-CoA hydratase